MSTRVRFEFMLQLCLNLRQAPSERDPVDEPSRRVEKVGVGPPSAPFYVCWGGEAAGPCSRA
eukprot:10590422-Lingulodinium_polyedra.AAC.1